MKTGMSESGMNLTHERFAQLQIPLPPLLEQKRIADKLEQLLERVTQSAARLDTALTAVKRFRQAVLAAAVSGKLTEEWREENGISSEWVLQCLGEFDTRRAAKRSLQIKLKLW